MKIKRWFNSLLVKVGILQVVKPTTANKIKEGDDMGLVQGDLVPSSGKQGSKAGKRKRRQPKAKQVRLQTTKDPVEVAQEASATKVLAFKPSVRGKASQKRLVYRTKAGTTKESVQGGGVKVVERSDSMPRLRRMPIHRGGLRITPPRPRIS